MDTFVMYILVRTDLKMQRGKIAAQCGHAIEKLVLQTPKAVMHDYRASGHAKIIVQISSLEELVEIRDECQKIGLPCHVVKDAGLTQVSSGTATVLGIGPVRKKNVPNSILALNLL